MAMPYRARLGPERVAGGTVEPETFIGPPIAPTYGALFDLSEIAHWTPEDVGPEALEMDISIPEFPSRSLHETIDHGGQSLQPGAVGLQIETSATRMHISSVDPCESRQPGESVHKPKFKRRLLKPILRGNNRSGRTGVPTCGPCRHRKSKCLYVHPDVPCKFCRSRGIVDSCVKLFGEKTRARCLSVETQDQVELSRPLSRYDSSITEKDLNILEYVFFRDLGWHYGEGIFSAFIRKLISVFGLSVDYRGLRNSMLAFVVQKFNIEGAEPEDQSVYFEQAMTCMSLKLEDVARLDDSDIYASFFIALSTEPEGSADGPPKQRQACFVNMRHCLNVARELYNRNTVDNKTRRVPVPWYFMRSRLLTVWEACCDGDDGYLEFQELANGFAEMMGAETMGQFDLFYDFLGEGYSNTRNSLEFTTNVEVAAVSRRIYYALQAQTFAVPLWPSSPPSPVSPTDSIAELQTDSYLSSTVEILKNARRILLTKITEAARGRTSDALDDGICMAMMWKLAVSGMFRLMNHFLSILLEAPSIIDGLTSVKGIKAGETIGKWFVLVGGAMFLGTSEIYERTGDGDKKISSFELVQTIGSKCVAGDLRVD